MSELVEIRAIVRREMLDRVVHCLKASGVPRLTVTRVHAIGAGVDPATAKVSLDEGTAYADKAMIQFICAGDRCEMFTELIAREARTGRRGDGIVSIHPVAGVIKIRTGERGLAALA
jgi:nitrogen regulatory protein P-II 1